MFKWVGISNNIFQKFNITYKFHVDKSVEKTILFEMRLMPIVYLQDAVPMGCYGRCNQQARCTGIHTPSMFPFPADTCILVIVWSEQLISSFKSGCFTLMRDHQMPIRKSGDPKRCGYADQVGCIRVKIGPCTGCIIYIICIYIMSAKVSTFHEIHVHVLSCGNVGGARSIVLTQCCYGAAMNAALSRGLLLWRIYGRYCFTECTWNWEEHLIKPRRLELTTITGCELYAISMRFDLYLFEITPYL